MGFAPPYSNTINTTLPSGVNTHEHYEWARQWGWVMRELEVDIVANFISSIPLLETYADPLRTYHNHKHILSVLSVLRTHQASPVVLLAAFFHDYCKTNTEGEEEASADAARLYLDNYLPRYIVEQVGELIEYTACPVDLFPVTYEEALLRDADYSILAFEKTDYDIYSKNVRLEYGQWTDQEWIKGRMDFVARTLESPQIYWVPKIKAVWEEKARDNLRRELDDLRRKEVAV